MLRPSIKQLAKKEGWSAGKDVVFGVYKGYFFNIGHSSFWGNNFYKYITISFPSATSSIITRIGQYLEGQQEQLKFTTISCEGKKLRVHFEEKRFFISVEMLYQVLDALVLLFQQEKLASTAGCATCAATKVQYYQTGHSGVAYCSTCIKSMKHLFHQFNAQEDAIEKNYLQGFIGSLIFSLPVVLVWVLLAVWTGRIASVLSLVIFALGLHGYHRFEGILGKLTSLILIGSNIIMLVICNLATISTQLYFEGIPLSQTIDTFLHDEHVQSIFKDNLATSLILSCFIWLYFIVALKPTRYHIKAARKLG